MKELALIFCGWLLGLLGPAVVDEIRERRTFRSLRNALKVELDELRLTLVYVQWKIEAHRLTLNKDFIEWYCAHVSKYTGDRLVEEQRQMVEKLRAIPEDELRKILLARKEEGVVPGFRTYPTVVLQRSFEYIHRFKRGDQRSLFEIHTQLKLYNSLVQDVIAFFRMTFDSSLTPENRQKILGNQEDCISRLATTTKKIVDKIDDLDL